MHRPVQPKTYQVLCGQVQLKTTRHGQGINILNYDYNTAAAKVIYVVSESFGTDYHNLSTEQTISRTQEMYRYSYVHIGMSPQELLST
jgi:cellobiose phosphorylase